MFLDTLTYHSLPKLRCLDLAGVDKTMHLPLDVRIGEEGMVGLVCMMRSGTVPVLEELILRGCALGERELSHLSYAIQDGYGMQLRNIDLSDNAMKRDGVIIVRRMLSKEHLPNLETLDLSNNKLGDAGITELGNTSDLKCLDQVKTLHLCHNNIADEGASCIYLYVRTKVWSQIQQLYLDGMHFNMCNRQTTTSPRYPRSISSH